MRALLGTPATPEGALAARARAADEGALRELDAEERARVTEALVRAVARDLSRAARAARAARADQTPPVDP